MQNIMKKVTPAKRFNAWSWGTKFMLGICSLKESAKNLVSLELNPYPEQSPVLLINDDEIEKWGVKVYHLKNLYDDFVKETGDKNGMTSNEAFDKWLKIKGIID